jgi:UDP-N-acetyl-D-mannosaminuronate dehydrogenase
MIDKKVCVVGVGYVGLPLAEAFAKHLKVIGFDINESKLRSLRTSNNLKNLLNTHLTDRYPPLPEFASNINSPPRL